MKKLTAILLLGVFMFNLFGYKLWVSYIENAADQSLEKAFDQNNYKEDELITVKKPINLPYYNNTKEFTRADGEIELDGVYYKYVKYRVCNGYVEMLCLPNTQKTKIRQAKDDFHKVVTDIQKNTSGKSKSNSGNTLKKMLGDFEAYAALYMKAPATTISTDYSLVYNSSLGVLHKASVEQPPDIFNS